MNISLSPEIRREIINFSSKENLTFEEALEHIAMEGIKIVNKNTKTPVNNHVYK